MKKILALVLCLAMVMVFFTVGASAAGTTYTFADYVAGKQYAENEVHVLDEKVTVTTNLAHFTTQLRLYNSGTNDSTAVIAITGDAVTAITLNAGNKAGDLEVSVSADGTNWTVAKTLAVTSAYADYTVEFDAATKYIKLDSVTADKQIRIASMSLVFESDAACQHANTVVKYDGVNHWTECADCHVITIEKAAHTLNNGTCSGCAISTLTISEANAKAVEGGSSYTSIGYLVSGTIKSVANTKYGNMTIMDAEGNELYLYGTYDVDGNSYEKMETKPVAGDSITVYTVLGTYTKNDVTTNRGKNATIIAHTPHTHDSNGEVAKNETHHWATCSLCGVKQGEEIGHTYTNGTCSCGAVDPEYVPIVVEDGTYIIASGNLAMTGLAADKNYGYPGAHEIGIAAGAASGFAKNDIITITNVTGGITLQDSQGRYLYMTGSYNSFNVSAELPEAGHIWSITKNEDGTYVLVNLAMNKTLAYSTQYTSYGAYSPLTDDHASAMTIIAVSESDATGDPIAVVLGLLAVSGMGIVVLKKKEF